MESKFKLRTSYMSLISKNEGKAPEDIVEQFDCEVMKKDEKMISIRFGDD